MWSVDLLVHPLSIVSAPYQGEEAHHSQEGELTSEGPVVRVVKGALELTEISQP